MEDLDKLVRELRSLPDETEWVELPVTCQDYEKNQESYSFMILLASSFLPLSI